MVQPVLMTALKPGSVGRPPGVATMTLTADTELNGYTNIIDNSPSYPGANWTGKAKAGDAAPTPTTQAKKNGKAKRGFSRRTLTKKRDKRIAPRRGTRYRVAG